MVDPRNRSVHQYASSCGAGPLYPGSLGALLVASTTAHTTKTAVTAIMRGTCFNVPADNSHLLFYLLRSFFQGGILMVVAGVIRIGMDGIHDGLQMRLIFLAIGKIQSMFVFPLFQYVIRGREGARPVYGGSSAETAPRKYGGAPTLGNHGAGFVIQFADHVHFPLGKLLSAKVGPFFHEDDVMPLFRENSRCDASTSSTSYHHHITFQSGI